MALEKALQIERAELHRLGELGKAGRAGFTLLEGVLDEPAGAAHPLDRRIERREGARAAALAGAVAGTLGRLRQGKELDIAAQWPPARAGGAAIDMRRAHRIDEAAIRLSHPVGHGAPALLFGHSTNPWHGSDGAV